MLELRSTSREAKDVLLEYRVPSVFVHILIRKLNLKDPDLTMKSFWRQVARLGGFIGRKSDGDLGWLRLLDMAWVVEKCG